MQVCSKCKKDKSETEYREGHKACNTCLRKDSRQYARCLRLNQPWTISYKCTYNRCTNPKEPSYERYGARGIKLLMSKEDFKKLWFRDKAYEMIRPTMHRENNDGNYEVSNCKFLENSDNLSYGKPRICVIKKCNGKVEGWGLCKKHYRQYWVVKNKENIKLKEELDACRDGNSFQKKRYYRLVNKLTVGNLFNIVSKALPNEKLIATTPRHILQHIDRIVEALVKEFEVKV